jgi:predicted permease
VWTVERLLPAPEVRLILSDMEELHRLWCDRVGAREARRRFLHQWRRYPLALIAAKLRGEGVAPRPSRTADAGSGAWLTPRSLAQSARALGRTPLLTGAILVTVGLGIGGCTTIFSLVDALYLRPLPYPDADQVMAIFTDAPPNRFPFSAADWQALKAQQTSFRDMGAYGRTQRTLLTPDGAALLSTLEVTPGLLDVWGVRPLQGRLAAEADGTPDAPPTVLVTLGFAQRSLGAGRDGGGAVGSTLNLDGEAYEVVGVLPADLGPLARSVEVVPTLRLQPPSRKGPFFLRPFGRLRDGVAPESAHAELRTLNERLFPVWADSYQDRSASWGLQPVPEAVRGDVGTLLAVLMAAVGIVFLIALANAANLLVARVNARSRELAVRSALGASRGRIWGHLFTESLLLAAGGVGVGLAVSRWGVATLPVVASSYLQRADEAAVSGHVVLFALALSAVSALLFSAAPALRGDRADDLASELRAGGRGTTGGGARQGLQRVLVMAQIALVVPLLAGAFLLLQSFVRLQQVDPGFDVERIVSMRVSLSPATHPGYLDRRRFWDDALARIEALPGVQGAALASERPPDDVNDVNNFDLEDRPTAPGEPIRLAAWVYAGPGFFDVMGIPLLEGRGFQPADLDADAPPVLVADEAWVRRNYPGERAVGRRMYSGGQTSGPRATVVGVVGSVPYQGVGVSDLGALYAPSDNGFGQPWLLVRTSGDAAAGVATYRDAAAGVATHRVAAAVQAELRRLDPTAPITRLATGEALLQDALTRPRHLTLMAGIFSAVALALSVVGIYGVTSYAVQRRRGDIAVRLALGGDPGAVLGMTLWNGMRLAVVGLAVGVAAALLVTRALSSLLYQVAPTDPVALAGAGLLLLGVSTVATLVPALAVIRVDPATVLREE